MVSLDIGLIGATAAVFGFVIAYYAFARMLHIAEEDRQYRYCYEYHTVTPDGARDAIERIGDRRRALNIILSYTSVVSLVAFIVDLSFLTSLDTAFLNYGIWFFSGLVGVVTLFFAYVGWKNTQEMGAEKESPQAPAESIEDGPGEAY